MATPTGFVRYIYIILLKLIGICATKLIIQFEILFLGHRYCRAFITHGGLNSLQEAIYHGVPVLGMPFGTDQTLNVGRAVKEGYAIMLDWTDFTQETLFKAIQDLLHNPR